MGIRQMLICVGESGYARRLAEYISQQRDYLFRVHFCDTVQTGQRLARTIRPEYVLVDEAFSEEERRGFGGGRRFVLTESAGRAANGDEIPVFKYQSGRGILETMVKNSLDDPSLIVRDRKSLAVTAGFFSPVNRIGQTGLALDTGRRLAVDDGALYLNLCAYAAGGHFTQTEAPTLADLLYFLEQDMPNTGLRLKALTSQTDGLDYLNPMTSSGDLKDVGPDMWLKMIDALKAHASYGYILLDIGGEVRGVSEILSECDVILMPVLGGAPEESKCSAVLGGPLEEAKCSAFLDELRQSGAGDLARRIKKVPMEREKEKIVESCVKLITAERESCAGPR